MTTAQDAPRVTLQLTKTEERTWRRRTVKFHTYTVRLDDEVIGTVYRDMATRERRGKGQQYVSLRWESPAWYWKTSGGVRRDRQYAETRQDALTGLIAHMLSTYYYDARALAKTATIVRNGKATS